jgi:hypothetical protein
VFTAPRIQMLLVGVVASLAHDAASSAAASPRIAGSGTYDSVRRTNGFERRDKR